MKILRLFVAVIMACCMATAPLYAKSFPVGTRLFKPTISDPTITGTTTIGTGSTVTSPTITSPTITSPTITGTTSIGSGATITTPIITSPAAALGFTEYAYTSASGAAYTVVGTVACPAVYKITGGSGSTTFVMSYSGTAASSAGKMFYIINCSSNTVTFKQSGVTGVSVATSKIVTVVGNGTDFERITADQ